jgi:hypothetical protein
MNSDTAQSVPLLFRIVGAIAKLRPTFNLLQVPEGYQDENGFHYGKPPVAQEIVWPPSE